MRSSIGNAKILDQRVPASSPKYKAVGPRINSGSNVLKIMREYEGTSGPNARIKAHDEYFQRLRPTTLGALLEQLTADDESIYALGAGENDARSIGGASARSIGAASVSHSAAAAHTITHHAEAPSPSAHATAAAAASAASLHAPPPGAGGGGGQLLLLDIRPPDEFEKWRVRGAVSYPPSQMIHASNSLPHDIYYYKGARDCGKMVVVIDADGRSAAHVANILVEKGVENTFAVRGGLAQFAPRFRHLLEGDVPALPMPPASPAPSTLSALARRGSGSAPGSASPLGASPRPPSTAQSARSARTVNTQLSGVSSRAGGGAAAKPAGGAWK